jgi:hypothetical protein
MSEIEIFSSRGGSRPTDSFKPEELAKLTPARREIFDHLRKAAADCEATEAELLTAQAALGNAVKNRAAAISELNRVRPKRTFMDEWRQTFKGKS